MATERESELPTITADQMAKVDQIMMGELGLNVLQVMELAGWAVAAFARERFLENDPREQHILVLAGSGGNGGDGMVAARHLRGWGAEVTVLLSAEPHLNTAANHQLQVLRTLDMDVRAPRQSDDQEHFDLIIDGLLGFSLRSAPRGVAKSLIELTNERNSPVLAIDLPSGLDATNGTVFEPCINADTTLTLGLPKTGLFSPEAADVIGDLFAADIGVPAAAYAAVGLDVGSIFADAFWRAVPTRRGP
jgi:NAD(P)H-hydrate epimerase